MIYLDTFIFPSPPDRIGINGGAVYQTYSLLAGRASIPGGKDIKSVKMVGYILKKAERKAYPYHLIYCDIEAVSQMT